MRTFITLFIILILITGCSMDGNMEKWEQEIRDTEKAFADMVAKEGMHKAFVAFAADDAVLLRSEKLIIGKPAIDTFYDGANATGLSWKPEHVEVAKSGDLAYTYGHYIYTYTDKDGKEQRSTGVFHSVWKRQEDGSWKYVWD